MHRAVLTLLVGLMLSPSGGASALTFGKDGKQETPDLIPDRQTPPELLAPVDSEDKLLMMTANNITLNTDYSQEWNLCNLIAHNIYLL